MGDHSKTVPWVPWVLMLWVAARERLMRSPRRLVRTPRCLIRTPRCLIKTPRCLVMTPRYLIKTRADRSVMRLGLVRTDAMEATSYSEMVTWPAGAVMGVTAGAAEGAGEARGPP